MESTWERRDLPVLDAVVRYFEERDPMDPHIPDVRTFAEITGLPVEQVYRAARSLAPSYLSVEGLVLRRPGRAVDYAGHRPGAASGRAVAIPGGVGGPSGGGTARGGRARA